MAARAEIIFCPYNYIIDPIIRSEMDINLKNDVIIFDEGHNILNVATDSASHSVTLAELEEGVKNLNLMIGADVEAAAHVAMRR